VTDTVFKGLDRFGLAPILLIGLAYIGHREVVVPIAAAYTRMVSDVDENNRLLKQSLDENMRDDAVAVAAITEAQRVNRELSEGNRKLSEENRELNTRILDALERVLEEMQRKPPQ